MYLQYLIFLFSFCVHFVFGIFFFKLCNHIIIYIFICCLPIHLFLLAVSSQWEPGQLMVSQANQPLQELDEMLVYPNLPISVKKMTLIDYSRLNKHCSLSNKLSCVLIWRPLYFPSLKINVRRVFNIPFAFFKYQGAGFFLTSPSSLPLRDYP